MSHAVANLPLIVNVIERRVVGHRREEFDTMMLSDQARGSTSMRWMRRFGRTRHEARGRITVQYSIIDERSFQLFRALVLVGFDGLH
jgi:hypothetical protein